jgi:hypothetical protein
MCHVLVLSLQTDDDTASQAGLLCSCGSQCPLLYLKTPPVVRPTGLSSPLLHAEGHPGAVHAEVSAFSDLGSCGSLYFIMLLSLARNGIINDGLFQHRKI